MVGANGGARRDERYRRHAQWMGNEVVEPRRSPRGIRTRMTRRKMSRVERKRNSHTGNQQGFPMDKQQKRRVDVVVEV